MQNALSNNELNKLARKLENVDKDGKPTKWQFKNSWGAQAGHNGYLTFTDEWFDEYMFRIVIHKDFVTPEALKIYNSKATLLPPWDWMF